MVGCASKEEKEKRRQDAFDVSGEYTTSSVKSKVEMSFEIFNEAGRHDVRAVLTRKSPITDAESDLLTKNKLDAARVFRHFFDNPLNFGKGERRDHIEGGENISDDSGKSSRFKICTRGLRIKSESDPEPEFVISYCLEGKARKGKAVISGALVLNVTREEEVRDPKGGKTTKYTLSVISLPYATQPSFVFFKQYLGRWKGQVSKAKSALALTAAVSDLLSSITITDLGENYLVEPARKSLDFEGESYTFSSEDNFSPTSDLKNVEFPTILFSLNSPSRKQIVFVGQIWSLGSLTGSLIQVDGTTETKIATVKFRKK